MVRPHVKEGSLVVIAGNTAGIVISRIDKSYYKVWCEGVLHNVHRDDFVVLRSGYGEDEDEEE